MDRYQRVDKPKGENPIAENEIRITSRGRTRSYITYALNLLEEKGSDVIVFKAMGKAINKTVAMVELIKRRIVGLHQITSIHSIDITDTWEPLEEGLQTIETTRKVSMITINLSKTQLDKTNIGYQPPIPADQVKVSAGAVHDYDEGEGSPLARGGGRGGRGRRGGGGGRVYYGNEYAYPDYVEGGGYEQRNGYTRGRGWGRNQGTRGRGRGRYGGPPMDTQHEAGSYYNEEAPRGRGRSNRSRGRGFRSNE